MLTSHAYFIAQVSEEVAERFVTSFEEKASSLETMPHRCPWFSGDYIPKNVYRYLLIEKRYMILFQIKEHIVYADYILDCRQDYQWIIRRNNLE